MLSIVIPTLNEEKYLPGLLASLARQQDVPFEIIVADAGSNDRTSALAARSGARIVAGGMPGAGRNRGAAAAEGDLLLFLDADVILSDDHFLKDVLVEFHRRDLDIATCEIEPLSDERIDRLMHWVYNQYTRSLVRLVPHVPGFFILITRKLHERIKGFDETIRYAEDQDYAIRAARHGSFGFLQSRRIAVSVRRFERDGRFGVAAKNVLAEVHMRTLGPIRSDILRYRFGYDQEDAR